MKQALLVIDVQESFRQRPYYRADEVPAFLAAVQSLIGEAVRRGSPIVQVLHREPGDDAGNPFTAASGFVRPMPELALEPQAVFHKQVHSALYGTDAAGVTLEAWLRARSGREYSPAEIRERTELVLEGRFARVLSAAAAFG